MAEVTKYPYKWLMNTYPYEAVRNISIIVVK